MGLAQSVQDAGEAVADRMKKNQQDMMTAQMERQMRAMQVQMMAVTRERTLWFGGVTSALALALLVGAARGKNVAMGLIPLTVLSTVTAYQWDLGYGTKINRIRDMQQDILRDERYWFVEKQDKK